MDTSETYIKMCDCPEIQEKRCEYPRIHDFIHDPNHYPHDMRIKDLGWHENSIWLPCQDQIQEMMDFHDMNVLMCGLWAFHSEMLGYVMDLLDSMEKIWLVFYMKENHSKLWDGKKWSKK